LHSPSIYVQAVMSAEPVSRIDADGTDGVKEAP
jgi:hypothetical protein